MVANDRGLSGACLGPFPDPASEAAVRRSVRQDRYWKLASVARERRAACCVALFGGKFRNVSCRVSGTMATTRGLSRGGNIGCRNGYIGQITRLC